ncbi:MAG: D-aminoacyl-tRNA deacylase [Balneolaceae bacterium]|nr:D-aminoacyl-tRNA deacylase [Balneolaceae bacterium]
MKVVVQRVREAAVKVEGEQVGSIENGLLLLVGIHREDTGEKLEWMSRKILNLRVFDDDDGKMNYSVEDVGGELLVVSQFTLYGDARKGNRPSYIEAAGPEKAEEIYDEMITYFRSNSGITVQSGVFGAEMDVSLVNDGPVTIILEN